MKFPTFILILLPCFVATAKHDLTVVTVATEETDGLKRLLKSAETFDLNVEVIGLGEEWKGGDTRIEQGGGQKIRLLSEWIKPYKDQKDKLILFVDAYDVIFNAGADEIIYRFNDNFEGKRLLFGAEQFCWPDPELAPDYPIIEFGKRFLNSGLFLGYAPEVFKILTLKEVEDKDDDQLYYTKIYLDDKLREELKMDLDSMARIFQNLNGVVGDVELQIPEEGKAEAYNAAYNTHPIVIHGNGPSKIHLNYLGNYLAQSWTAKDGCAICGKKDIFSFEDKSESDHPLVSLNVFLTKPIPFIEEVFEQIGAIDYPKKKIALYIYNNEPFSIKDIMNFLEKYGTEYYHKKIINGVTEIGEREARDEAVVYNLEIGSEFALNLDAEVYILNKRILKDLIEASLNYNIGIVAPMVGQIGKLFTNFWGALAKNGYYARSEDYMAIVQRKRIGVFNVPFVTSAVLVTKEKLQKMKNPNSYNKNIDPDMSFANWARDNGHFMYVSNEENQGYMIVNEEYAETVTEGKWHPELWQIFENRQLWEQRYVHPQYWDLLKPENDVPQACPDVYDFPLVSERFSEEFIEEVEGYGKWSDGSNKDDRLAGGYENVPTRDIHMNQIGFARQWLYFLNEYVRPIQEKTFIGYYHNPIEANMMFVVRYRPDEQPSLRPHHDASTFSIDIALNKKGRDYQGGGVKYVRYNCTVPADEVGHTMMFPGRLTHLHEGLPTTEGTRYILVSFINP